MANLRKLIRNFLNKRGYEIIKKPYIGKQYPEIKENGLLLYRTPIGNYYFPEDAQKDGMLVLMSRGKVHDEEVVNIAKRYIKPGTAVLDIGANFGQMSLIFSRLAGPAGKVYAFEAQPKVLKSLEMTVKGNEGAGNIIIKDGAVYDQDDKILFFPEADTNDANAYSSNAINPGQKSGRGHEIKAFRIDSMQIPEPVSFAKVDIQGSDLFALRGAKETIMKNRMPIIFEYEQEFQDQFGTSFQDYIDFVAEIGYKFEEIVLKNNYLIVPQ